MTWYELLTLVLSTMFGGGALVVLVTLKSTRKTATAEAQGAGTDANEKLMQSYEEHILNPILKSNERTNRKLDRLSRAIEKIPTCPHAPTCPVSVELQKQPNACDGEDGDIQGGN